MKSMIMEVSGNRRGFVGGRILRTLSQQSEQKPIDDIKMDGESFSTKNAMANDKHEVNIFIHAYRKFIQEQITKYYKRFLRNLSRDCQACVLLLDVIVFQKKLFITI